MQRQGVRLGGLVLHSTVDTWLVSMPVKHGGQGGRFEDAVCPQLQLLGGGGLQALGGVWA